MKLLGIYGTGLQEKINGSVCMSDNKINVTYLIDMIGWAGAQTHLISVLNNINYDEFNVNVICLRRAGTQFELLEKLPVTAIVCNLENLMNPIRTIATVIRLKNFIKASNTDILQSYMFNPNLMASIISWLPGKKFKLITTRRDTGYWHQSHHWWLYKVMNVVTDKIIAVSSEVRLQSIKNEGVNPDKIITIYNGIDVEMYNADVVDRDSSRDKFSLNDNDFVIGLLAALRPEKRHDVFIRAAVQVIKKIPNAKFMIVGDGSKTVLKNIKHLLDKYGVNEQFLLTGKLTDVISVLKAFDVSVLCSDTEGMSNTVLQSIAMAKATIVTNVGGNPEVIENKKNGLVFHAGDSDKLAQLIINLYQDHTLKNTLEVNAAATVVDKFNIVPIIESLQNVYIDILNKNP
ncbi:MAG: glycosyltransferase [Thiohalomonadales bacterium]